MSSIDRESATPPEALEALHQRVNALLDTPLPEESEVWELRLDTSPANIPPGHDARESSASSPVGQ